MNPDAAAELDATQRQLLTFAEDLQRAVRQERLQREEADTALRELRTSYTTMVRTLATVCEMKDRYTRTHLDRTYQYAMRLTQRVAPEMSADAGVHYGYLLHDIGKVGIPDGILNKPGPLDDDEWRVMRTHPIVGLQLVRPIKFLGDAIEIVKSHHERWDGTGYPERLAGEDIYVGARIFAIIDAWDAMTTDRSYRDALPIHVALEEIDAHKGTQFDPALAEAFIDLCEDLDVEQHGAGRLATVR